MRGARRSSASWRRRSSRRSNCPAVLRRRGSGACHQKSTGSPVFVGRVRRSRHPAQNRLRARCPCPAALRLRGPTKGANGAPNRGRFCRPGKAPAATRHKIGSVPAVLARRRYTGAGLRRARIERQIAGSFVGRVSEAPPGKITAQEWRNSVARIRRHAPPSGNFPAGATHSR